ncbi:hypothetical protein niasHT_008866 [Heterodera trifolii]|uniref:ShKT domain-containing protein n=1 Tax=Heterodera trifolii TaxID=157864 RepID=A0ABD2L1B1_9BILA
MMLFHIYKFVFIFLVITLEKQQQFVDGQQYFCYEVVRDITTGANDCPPPLVYQPSVQLCCGQQPIPNGTIQQTFDQLPQPGSPDAIPDGCERALRFPSGLARCRAGLILRTIGRNQLCCSPNVQLPPSLTGNQGLITRPRVSTGPGAALSACVDLAAPGRASDCPSRRDLCNDPIYRDLMTQQCPQTCNRCGARAALGFANANVAAANGACFDRVGPNGRSDCPDRVAYCTVPMYRSLMIQECPFTCNLCNTAALSLQQQANRFVRPRISQPSPWSGINLPQTAGGVPNPIPAPPPQMPGVQPAPIQPAAPMNTANTPVPGK